MQKNTKATIGLLLFLALCTGLIPANIFAKAGEYTGYTTVIIDSGEKLMEVLNTSSDQSGDTLGKIYVLEKDVTIDTSGLDTGFSTGGYGLFRKFRGVLDGNGHTITVESKQPLHSNPLFDCIEGNRGTKQSAGVRNLRLVFSGDVAGTTVAATAGYAKFENLSVTVNGDIVFAEDHTGQYAIATGLLGFQRESGDVIASGITVSAKTIGSREPVQSARNVLAAGVFSEWNLASSLMILDGISVEADDIVAVSGYKTAGTVYSAVCAAGIASGYSQTNLRLARAKVTVNNSIRAEGTGGSTADADAFGLAYGILAMYECSVKVGGNIEARGWASPVKGSARLGGDSTITAAGMGYSVETKYNQSLFGVPDSGKCSVTVEGDIIAEVLSAGNSPTMALASGVAAYTNQAYTWRDVSVKTGKIHAKAADLSDAVAVGFAYQTIHTKNETQDKYDYENCAIEAIDISASASDGGGYAFGFMMWGYSNFLNCSIAADSIAATGVDAAAAGFAYRFTPTTEAFRTGDKTGGIKSCRIVVDHIVANHTDPQYSAECAALVCNTGNAGLSVKGSVSDCELTVSESLQATGENAYKGILLIDNTLEATLFNNTVSLPMEQADVVTIDQASYVRFSAGESPGRGGETPEDTAAWESGNKVIFLQQSENEVFCRFDDSNAEGTLWKILNPVSFYTVVYKADGQIIDTQYIRHGENATAPEIPHKEGYDRTPPYWDHDGRNILQDTEIHAVYTPNRYTVTYMVDGTAIDTQYVQHGENATAPEIPHKEGYDQRPPYWDHDGRNIMEHTLINAVYIPNSPEPTDVVASAPPVTGDSSRLTEWLSLLLISGAGLIVSIAYQQARKRNR